MNRSFKNIISIGGIFIGLIIIIASVLIAKNNLTTVSNNSFQMGERPSMPSNGNMNQPPEMNGEEPPEKPDGNESDMGNPPEKPDTSNNSSNNNKPSINESFVKEDSVTKLTVGYIIAITCGAIILSVSLVYLILSLAGRNNVFVSFDKGLIFVLLSVIFTIAISYGTVAFTNNNILLNNSQQEFNDNFNKQSNNGNSKGKKEVTSSEKLNDSYSSTDGDENTILVKDGGSATIENAQITKSGDSNDSESADFYGLNAAILTTSNSKTTIKDSTITTDGKGASGVFAYNSGEVEISDSKIKTTGSNSGALMVTGGGILTANNVTAETSGNSSAPIRSDRGGGTLTVNNGTYTSNGVGSPVIYSTAEIVVNNAKLISNASEGVVVEGKNSVTLNNVNMEVTNNKLNGNSETYKAIFIYQSMSGDADVGTSKFSAKDSKIVNNNGDVIYVTNTKTEITLENNEIINNDSNGAFLRVSAAKWGTSGSNGGDVTLNMTNQKVSGDIVIDNISTLELNLNKSTYKGSINNENTAKSIKVSLSKDSKWTLTSDSYITELNDKDSTYSNIDLNGYKLYVNGKELKK